MIRVVVTGSECTGKTTLAEALAEHYHTECVAEYARRFVLHKGAPPVYADVEAIARGQIALEDEVTGRSPDLVFQDTDLLSTVVYSRHYYGDCPAWIEDALMHRVPDLYLLGLKIQYGDIRGRTPLLMLGVLLMLVGVQFISIGLLGEMIARIQQSDERDYSIRERLD